ncbi:MAG: YqgE/AlgH family protein [Bacteroidota bacterium]
MQGKLLIAHPLLSDAFFNRSVIYLTNHNQEGSVGFCINVKTQFCLRDVRPQIKNGNLPIFEGGPVAKNQLFFMHTLGKQISDSVHISKNIYVGGNFDELMHGIEHNSILPHQLRLFAGYSCWGEHQLEDEIANQHWLLNSLKNNGLFLQNPDDLWSHQLAEIKSSYKVFADFANTPSLN